MMWPFHPKTAGPTPAEMRAATEAMREATAALAAATNEIQILWFRIAELRATVDRATAALRSAELRAKPAPVALRRTTQ